MKNAALAFSFLFALVFATPAYSQLGGEGYNCSGGGSRVVRQCSGGRGYGMPGSTAISSGTMSQSARGINQAGEQINPGLPRVRWGSTISTAGDAQYQSGFQTGNQRRVDIPNVANTAIINTRLPGVNWGGTIGTAGDCIRSDFHPELNRYNAQWWNAPVPGTGVVRKLPKWASQGGGAATYSAPAPGTGGGASYGSSAMTY